MQSPSDSSRVYHVTDYGADPTGNKDSTVAIARAISDAFSAPSDRVLMPGIKDLGGPKIHLDGGAYLISSPIALPSSGGGNLKVSPEIICSACHRYIEFLLSADHIRTFCKQNVV